MKRVIVGLFALVMIFSLYAAGVPGHAQAATSVIYINQSCSGGILTAALSWQGNDTSAQQQWIDLSLADNGWANGTFISAGPITGSSSSYSWIGLQSGVTHYVRTNQQLASGAWDPSPTFSFTTNNCGSPASAPSQPASSPPVSNATALPTCKLLNDVGPKTAAAAVQTVPTSSAQGDIAKFSGVWEGKWGGSAPSVLIVTVTQPGHADAFYGYNGPASNNQEGTSRLSLDYANGTLSDRNYSFSLNGNGVVVGQYYGASINMNACKP